MAVPQLASALNLPTVPVGVSQSQNPSVATNSYLVVTLSSVPSGFDVSNGNYLAWCGESQNTTVDTNPKTAILYSTYDPALPVTMQNANWPKVNYVLNHKQGTPDDIQQAIWVLLNGNLYDFTGSVTTPSTLAQAMISDANSNGGGFTPSGGQVTAVVVYQDGYAGTWQDTIIEVKVPSTAPNWCGLTWGFWKNHTSVWPVYTLTMGGKLYSYQELSAILGAAVKGDDSINLAHQLIAAKLNYEMGVYVGVGSYITNADSLLAQYSGKVPLKVKNAAMVSSAADLNNYNSDGKLQPGCTMRY